MGKGKWGFKLSGVWMFFSLASGGLYAQEVGDETSPLQTQEGTQIPHEEIFDFTYGSVSLSLKASELTPLQQAIMREDDRALSLLADVNTQINAKTREGLTALHMAAYKGNYGVIEYLLGREELIISPLGTNTQVELSPLQLAIEKHHIGVVELLIDEESVRWDRREAFLLAMSYLHLIKPSSCWIYWPEGITLFGKTQESVSPTYCYNMKEGWKGSQHQIVQLIYKKLRKKGIEKLSKGDVRLKEGLSEYWLMMQHGGPKERIYWDVSLEGENSKSFSDIGGIARFGHICLRVLF